MDCFSSFMDQTKLKLDVTSFSTFFLKTLETFLRHFLEFITFVDAQETPCMCPKKIEILNNIIMYC